MASQEKKDICLFFLFQELVNCKAWHLWNYMHFSKLYCIVLFCEDLPYNFIKIDVLCWQVNPPCALYRNSENGKKRRNLGDKYGLTSSLYEIRQSACYPVEDGIFDKVVISTIEHTKRWLPRLLTVLFCQFKKKNLI